ncbi:hypothetical protein MNBD_BACTEROID01-990 [hydrothermal vent metagenome]|uniref:Thioredoxin domain-containing protein n=1 Tax=hydrothermal vent metagenome TaxID=652676 RepID=A0A3B0TBZ0_9ZZZZ
MKRNIGLLVLLASLSLLWGCEKPNRFVIKGRITHAEQKMIYLDELLVTSTKPVDSVKIDKNGKFKFKHTASIPTFYLLKLSGTKFITLLVDSAETVSITADAVDFSTDYSIEGSEGSLLVQELNNKLNRTKQQLDSISSLFDFYQDSPDYTQIKTQLTESYNRIMQKQIDFSTDFIQKHPFSMASVLALYQKFDDNNYIIRDLQSLKVAASALKSFYPQSEHVKALYANTLKLMKDESTAKFKKLLEEKAENSPEIVLPAPNGKEIKLSSLRGKYVLVHFWSATDRGSRILNPLLVEVYNKYHRKGFEIYQVSVDKNRYEWLDAIDKDRLRWTNVGDMEGSKNAVIAYNIKEIPFNYLLDREGSVIARNLKGPSLFNTLSKIFN